MAQLAYKLHITGTLTVETGLHIGGSEAELDIGGIDSSVIKVKHGSDRVPYIPGSSLKGKLRNLIARSKGYPSREQDKDETRSLFEGDPPAYQDNRGGKYEGRRKHRNDRMVACMLPSRLIVRDSYLKLDKGTFEAEKYLEDKAENVLDRAAGGANPRHLERVVKGSQFEIDIILDVYQNAKGRNNDDVGNLLDTLRLGFQLIQKDYLGGSGTRGYGQVSLSDLSVKKMNFRDNGDIEKTNHEYDFSLDSETATA